MAGPVSADEVSRRADSVLASLPLHATIIRSAAGPGPDVLASGADRALSGLGGYSDRLGAALPPRLTSSDPRAVLESAELRDFRALLRGGIDSLTATIGANPSLDASAFFPNRVPESLFWRDSTTPLAIISTADDESFRRFVAGEAGTYRGRGNTEWMRAHSAELEAAGIRATVSGDGFTLVNTRFSAAFSRGVLSGLDFERFISGESPAFSGNNAAAARWLRDNEAMLRERGILLSIEGNRFTLTNSGFLMQPFPASLFDGSGLSGTGFRSFVEGTLPVLEGNNAAAARWILDHQGELEASGIYVHVELNSRGEPSGRFGLHNTGFLPPSIGPDARSALGRAISEARVTADLAGRFFEEAQRLRSTGNPADLVRAREYTELGLLYMERARATVGAVDDYVRTARMIYARRLEIERLPAGRRDEYRELLRNAEWCLVSTMTARGEEERTDGIRRGAFLLHYFEGMRYIEAASERLPPELRASAERYMHRAMELFREGSAESLERAYFIMGHTHSLVTYSLEREAVRRVNEDTRGVSLYFNVEGLAPFQTDGRFDPEKFRRLTGVSYDDYQRGAEGARRGLGTILARMYGESLAHYDRSITALTGAIDAAVASEVPDIPAVRAALETAFGEHEIGSLSFARTADLDVFFQSIRNAANMSRRLPSEADVRGLGLGADGTRDLLGSRDAMSRAYRAYVTNLSDAFFYSLAAQNSAGGERASFAGEVSSRVGRATALWDAYVSAATSYNNAYYEASGVAGYINTLGSTADQAVLAADLLRAAADDLGRLRDSLADPARRMDVLRPYFLAAVTDPSFLPSFPHSESLIRSIAGLARGASGGRRSMFRTLEDPHSSPENIRSFLDTLESGSINVIRRRAVDTGRERGRIWEYRDVPTPVPFSEGLRELDPDLAATLGRLRADPSSFSADARRDIVDRLMRYSGYESRLGMLEGMEVFRVFYDPHANPAQILGLIDSMSSGSMASIRRTTRVAVDTGRDHGRIWEYHDVPVTVPFMEGLRERNPALADRLERLRRDPTGVSLEDRRAVLLDILRFVGDESTIRTLGSIETHMATEFGRVFQAHIDDLTARAARMPGLSMDIQLDSRFIIDSLRSGSFAVVERDGRRVVEFSDPLVREAYERLLRNAAEIQSIPDVVSTLLPELSDRLMPFGRLIADRVAEAEREYQRLLEIAELRRGVIIGGAVVGGLIAAPFTAGQSFWASAGIIGLGVGLGAGLPSMTFAIADYVRIRDDPRASPADRDRAYWAMMREIGMNATMILPVVGQATRAWALGRGALGLARIGYAAEIVGGLGMVGFGAYHGYEGVRMIGRGETGWGAFNVGLGAVMVLGGGALTAGGVGHWRALGRLGPGATPAAIARDAALLDEGVLVMGRAASGEALELTADRLAEIHSSAKRLSDFVRAGGRLGPMEARSLLAYNELLVAGPARDLAVIERAAARVAGGETLAADAVAEVRAAGGRLNAVGRFRPLAPSEASAVEAAIELARPASARLRLYNPDELTAITGDLSTAVSSGAPSGRVVAISPVSAEYSGVFNVTIRGADGVERSFIYAPRNFLSERAGVEIYRAAGESAPGYVVLRDGSALQEIVGARDLRAALLDPALAAPAREALLRGAGRSGMIDYALGLPDTHARNLRVIEVPGAPPRVARIDFENAGIGWGEGIIPGGAVSNRDAFLFWRIPATGTYSPGSLRAFVAGIDDGIAAIRGMDADAVAGAARGFRGTPLARTADGTASFALDEARIAAIRSRILAIQADPATARFRMLETMFRPMAEQAARGAAGRPFVEEGLGIIRSGIRDVPEPILREWAATFTTEAAAARTDSVRSLLGELRDIMTAEAARRGITL